MRSPSSSPHWLRYGLLSLALSAFIGVLYFAGLLPFLDDTFTGILSGAAFGAALMFFLFASGIFTHRRG